MNSAEAAGRIEYIGLAASNDAIVIALCNGEGIAKDNDGRMMYMQTMMERGMEHGMNVEEDMWFDPLFLVIKGMQDKQMQVLEFIKMISDMGMQSTGGLSNNSNGMPKHIRPIMDSAMVAMAMMNGLTSAIVNPCDLRLMETIKSCDIIKNNNLYADSYLEISFRLFLAPGWPILIGQSYIGMEFRISPADTVFSFPPGIFFRRKTAVRNNIRIRFHLCDIYKTPTRGY